MRARHTGTIVPTKDGRFRPRLPQIYGRRWLPPEDTHGMAAAVLAVELERLAKEPLHVLTLAGWATTWLAGREATGWYRSLERDRGRWNKHVAETRLGTMALARIQPADVRRWLASLKGAPATRRNALSLVRSALAAAVDAGHIETNAAREVSLPRVAGVARGRDKWAWLTVDEIEKLLEVCKGEQLEVVTAAIYTGLRAGELWALSWPDVDLERGILRVHAAVTEDGRVGPTKSGRAREVPILPSVAWVFAPASSRSGLVWPGRWGDPHPRGHNADLPALLARAKVRRVRFHDLRHTCASHLVQGSWTRSPLRLEDVQLWLGHSSRTTTERYAHLSAEGLAARVACLTPVHGPQKPVARAVDLRGIEPLTS